MSKTIRFFPQLISACALLAMTPFSSMALDYDFEARPSGIPGYASVVKVVQDEEEKAGIEVPECPHDL